MGADVALYDACLGGLPCRFAGSNYRHSCVIKGPSPLKGQHLDVPDLRAGFSYLIAAIVAKGRSVISGIHHLDRGYEDIDGCLRQLGANIQRCHYVPEPEAAGDAGAGATKVAAKAT